METACRLLISLISLTAWLAACEGKERTDHRALDPYLHHVSRNPGGQLGPVPDEQRLLDYLMRGYERSVRPVRNASSPVVIQMGLTLTQVLDMDEKNQVLITNVWLDHQWHDEFLVWEPTLFNNITKIRIPCHKIWLPDMVLYNNAAEYTDGLMPANAMLEPEGKVFWPVPTKLQSSCKVDVTYFPFDTQECSLKFGSWTYDGYQVDVTNHTSEVDLSNYIVNGEWELVHVRFIRNVKIYACCPEPFPDVTFFIKIRRRTLYYMYNVVFPCVMMSALTLLVFCLPPDSGEKIALGITVLLAFSVFMLAVAENLPETSEFVPLISIYLTIVMTLTSVSVIMTVFVLNLHHRGPQKHSVPPWLRALFLRGNKSKRTGTNCHRGPGVNDHLNHVTYSGVPTSGVDTNHLVRNISLKMTLENIAQELRDEYQLESSAPREGENNPPSTTISQSPKSTATEQITESNTSSPAPFARHQSRSATPTPLCNNVNPRAPGLGTRSMSEDSPRSAPPVNASATSSATRSNRRRQRVKSSYEEALLSLTKLLERHELEEKEYDDIQDWRQIAQIVDRILFVFFLIATISSTLAVLVILPATQDS